MLSTRVRWGILGTKFISEEIVKAIQASENSETIAIGSRTMASAENFAHKLSIPKCYDDYQKLLADPDIDIVYIGLPNHLHKEWIIKCAEAGKHILCEKPFTLSVEEANEALAAVTKANVFCMEALMYYCHPFTKKLVELVHSGEIGEIRQINALYTANIAKFANPIAGGSIRNLGCYPASLIQLLANAEIAELTGLGELDKTTTNPHLTSVVIKFSNQIMATITTSDDIEMEWQFNVYGTKGHFSVPSNPWLPGETNKVIIHPYGTAKPYEIQVTADKSLYTYEIEAAAQAVINRDISAAAKNCVPWQHSLANLAILDNWLAAINSQNKNIKQQDVESQSLPAARLTC